MREEPRTEQRGLGDPVEEYREIGKNLRYYYSLRLVHLALFMLITAGLIVLVFGLNASMSLPKQILLKILGMLTAIAFFLMEERASDLWALYRARAEELEKVLGFNQYSRASDAQLMESFPYNKMSPGVREVLVHRFTVVRTIRWMFRVTILFWLFAMIRS